MPTSAPADYCLFFIQSACMPRSDWAAWVQAVGSILAIAAAWVVARRSEKTREQQEHSARQVRSLRYIAAEQNNIEFLCRASIASSVCFLLGEVDRGRFHFRIEREALVPRLISEKALKLLPKKELDASLSMSITAFIFAAQELDRRVEAAHVNEGWGSEDEEHYINISAPAHAVNGLREAFNFVAAEAQLLSDSVSQYSSKHLLMMKATRVQRWSKILGVDLPFGTQSGDFVTVTQRMEDGTEKSSSMKF